MVAFGEIHLMKKSEKHFGPHSSWFWDVNLCGGGALMKVLYAAYASAGEGRRIHMPFSASGLQKPIDLWFRGSQHRPHAPHK